MLRKLSAIATLGLLLGAVSAGAEAIDKQDVQLFKDVQKSVNRYTHFTIFEHLPMLSEATPWLQS